MSKLLVAALALSLLACHEADHGSQLNEASPNGVKLGLNDVSILLPYNKFPELFQTAPAIKDLPNPAAFAAGLAAAPLDNEAFVPEKYLREIDSTLSRDQENLDEATVFFRVNSKIFDYRLASFRIDPCANQLEIGKKLNLCRHEFRLVWQRSTSSGSTFRFDDNNIHAIHQMNDQQFSEIVATLRELKANSRNDSIGLALQPNPTIVEEGLDSNYYKGVIGLVHRYIRASNLIDIAFLADTNQSGHWPMLKLAVSNGIAAVIPIPGTEKNDQGQAFFVQRMDGRASLDEPIPLGNASHNLFRAANDQVKFNNAFALENPRLHGADSLDCASCHRANLEKEAVRGSTSNQVPANAYKSAAWNLDVLFGIVDEQSMQLFSFFGREVKIAPRTINESAEVADFINKS